VRQLLDEFAPDGRRILRVARGLAVGAKGGVYVAGMGSHNVLRVSAETPGAAARPAPPGDSSRP
jgi:hypothetical protein